MEGPTDEMAHDDIWDDSALIRSWDEALDEYKKYHSIHASGGKLEDLPEYSQDAKPETSDTHHQSEPVWTSAAVTSDQNTPSNQPARDSHEQITTGSTGNGNATKDGMNDGVASGAGSGDRHAGESHGQDSAGGNMAPPQVLLGAVQDEGLKRLLMSWYYAGYYTGLYEGKQARQDQQ
ncbi:hypothetical protein J7T55_006241 [Diaporthe amygdali]|uniref:uncharacterized protein n=1 Tax=Phomopsis amygdali TaxID=1214568 RepID=UPI0022FF2ABC|nr:uncharacterized protein J7T55_006241 [Diaporthe amygdali]KAJ0124898.1 hypothetical protein J7T55_006241 [Diaporthe amygdali]